jgi:hypothetical protein
MLRNLSTGLFECHYLVMLNVTADEVATEKQQIEDYPTEGNVTTSSQVD